MRLEGRVAHGPPPLPAVYVVVTAGHAGADDNPQRAGTGLLHAKFLRPELHAAAENRFAFVAYHHVSRYSCVMNLDAITAKKKVLDGLRPLPPAPLRKGSLVVNSSQGGGTKDTWVLAPDAPC